MLHVYLFLITAENLSYELQDNLIHISNYSLKNSHSLFYFTDQKHSFHNNRPLGEQTGIIMVHGVIFI